MALNHFILLQFFTLKRKKTEEQEIWKTVFDRPPVLPSISPSASGTHPRRVTTHLELQWQESCIPLLLHSLYLLFVFPGPGHKMKGMLECLLKGQRQFFWCSLSLISSWTSVDSSVGCEAWVLCCLNFPWCSMLIVSGRIWFQNLTRTDTSMHARVYACVLVCGQAGINQLTGAHEGEACKGFKVKPLYHSKPSPRE